MEITRLYQEDKSALAEYNLRDCELVTGIFTATKLLVDAGVTVAIGHTGATYEQTMAMIMAGATVGTHLFNGMRPPHHREPGPALALLNSPGVVCELIADGVHLHDGTVTFAARTAGAHRTALVTDATAAAGMPGRPRTIDVRPSCMTPPCDSSRVSG